MREGGTGVLAAINTLRHTRVLGAASQHPLEVPARSSVVGNGDVREGPPVRGEEGGRGGEGSMEACLLLVTVSDAFPLP